MQASYNINSVLPTGRDRYRFQAAATAATIDIFGEIDDFWGFGVREMAYNLSQNKKKKLSINIHSPGGNAMEGIGIANLIRAHDAESTATGIGFVASIASIVLLAADNVHMAENAFLMIHNPWTFTVGEADDLRHTADFLDKMTDNLAGIYAAKMQGNGNPVTLKQVKALMTAETWYTAEEAKAAGLIDKVTGSVEIAESAADAKVQNKALAKYSNTPQALADSLIFSNTNKTTKMADNKNLFAKLGQLFVSAAEEVEAPAATEEVPEEATTDATMTPEEMIQLLERDGYTVAKEEAPEPATEESPELVAIRAELDALKASVKRTTGAPSGAAKDDGKKDKNTVPKSAAPFFDNLATLIKAHRPG